MTKKIKHKSPKPAVVPVFTPEQRGIDYIGKKSKKQKTKKNKDILFCENWAKETKSKVENVEIIDWDGFIPKKAKVTKSLLYTETHTQVSFSMDKKELMTFSKYFSAETFAKIYKADKIIININR
jgi:hypothetical protein